MENVLPPNSYTQNNRNNTRKFKKHTEREFFLTVYCTTLFSVYKFHKLFLHWFFNGAISKVEYKFSGLKRIIFSKLT